MMAEPQSDKARFFTITALRIAGALMVAGGIILAFGDGSWRTSNWAMPLGIFLIANGFLDMFVIAPWLIKRWRTPG